MINVTAIPNAIYLGLDRGDIAAEQFDIFAYCYHKAERPAYMVCGYSAAQVCRFRWLDATDANVKRYERAAADLLARHLIRRDYYKIDPKRSSKKGRPYRVWVPPPARFQAVGAPEENALFLWGANVGLLVGHNVGLQIDRRSNNTSEFTDEEPDIVGLTVGLNANPMSISTQENQNQERESPLPPEGVSTPPLPGVRSNAAGLLESKPTPAPAGKKRKPLSVEQCAAINEVAILFADFTDMLYGFVPDTKATAALLRAFYPDEIFYAQLKKFFPGEKYAKNTMNHFFHHGAMPLIQAARINGTSKSSPKFEMEQLTHDEWILREGRCKWQRVLDAWEKVFGDNLGNIFEKMETERKQKAGETKP